MSDARGRQPVNESMPSRIAVWLTSFRCSKFTSESHRCKLTSKFNDECTVTLWTATKLTERQNAGTSSDDGYVWQRSYKLMAYEQCPSTALYTLASPSPSSQDQCSLETPLDSSPLLYINNLHHVHGTRRSSIPRPYVPSRVHFT